MESQIPKRRSVSRKAAIWSGARGIPCDIIDASETGCRIRLNQAADIGVIVKLHVAGLVEPRPGRVVWRRGEEAGIEFGVWPDDAVPPARTEAPGAEPPS